MPAIKVQNFTGEVPRLPARMLGDNAQINQNILATATEFRPLLEDTVADTGAPVGTVTLYKFEGATTFIKATIDANYVKTQLNDDLNLTDRTYFSSNTGAEFPVERSSTNATIRPLGVPFPKVKPVVTHVVVDEFTKTEGEEYIRSILTPQAVTYLKAAITEALVQPTNLYGTTVVDNTVTRVVSQTIADALGSSSTTIAAKALPLYSSVNKTALQTALKTIPAPNPPADNPTQKLLDGDQALADFVTDTLADLFDATGAAIKAQRSALDTAIKAFADATGGDAAPSASTYPASHPYAAAGVTGDPLDGNYATALAADTAQRQADIDNYNNGFKPPSPPQQPVGPEYEELTVGETSGTFMTAEWAAYRAKYDRYQRDLIEFNRLKPSAETQNSAIIANIKKAQTDCASLVSEIERINAERKDKLDVLVADAMVSLTKNIKYDPDRIVETRFYIYTYVNDRGEESAPSPVSDLIELDQNDYVNVAVVEPPGGYNITGYRIYRSNVASNGAEFQLLVPPEDLPTSARQFVTYTGGEEGEFLYFKLASAGGLNVIPDSVKSENLAEVCSTYTYLPPPVRGNNFYDPKGTNPYVRGFVNMPNGIIAGFIDNFVAFSEPYKPYAWPVDYQITTDTNIIGLGVFGQTLFVGTGSNPYLISGADPASMSADRLAFPQACVAQKSIVSVGDGVVYASPDGLCFVGHGGQRVITDGLFAREDWQALNPGTILAAYHDGVYYFVYSGSGGGAYAMDFNAKKLTRINLSATAFFREQKTDALFYVDGTNVKKFGGAATRRMGKWRSSIAVLPSHAGFAWLQVDGAQDNTNPVYVRWYADGVLQRSTTDAGAPTVAAFTHRLIDKTPVRLPVGRWLEHEVEIESKARITKVMMTSSTQELQSA